MFRSSTNPKSRHIKHICSRTRGQRRHVREHHGKFLKPPGRLAVLGAHGRCRGKNALFCQPFCGNNRKSLGQRPVDPCLSRWPSQRHPAGVPRISLNLMRLWRAKLSTTTAREQNRALDPKSTVDGQTLDNTGKSCLP